MTQMLHKVFSKLETGVVYIFCTLILMALLVSVIDLIQFIHDPTDYASVYKMDSIDWEANYIQQGIINIVILLSIFGFSFWRLIRPHMVLRLFVSGLYLIIFIALIKGYYDWASTGFDH